MTGRLVLVAAAALIAAQAAAAHAVPVAGSPVNGAVLERAPQAVTVTFDSPVRPGPEIAAVRNGDGSILGGPPYVSRSRVLVIPLRARLPHGDYTVRWSVVSDDGHEAEGLIAFAVGAGSAAPVPALSVHPATAWQRILMRVLLFAGVLGALGTVAFTLLVLEPLGLEDSLRRSQSLLLFGFFVAAFCGSDALANTAGVAGTRFAEAMTVAAVASAAGAVAATLTLVLPAFRYAAWSAAGILAGCPTAAGHSLDAGRPRIITPAADLLHLGAASVWTGGVASLWLVARRIPRNARGRVAGRFGSVALPALIVLATAGAAQALIELGSVGQLWSTGYGRALLLKSILLAAALALALLNRSALLEGEPRALRLLAAELAVLAGLAVAVGTLTDLRPGVSRYSPPASAPVSR